MKKKKDEVRVFYLRNQRNHPVATVASKFNEDESTVYFSLAVCSPQDSFKKEIGRMKATAQLNGRKKVYSIPISNNSQDSDTKTIKSKIMAVIPQITMRPQVHEAVTLWIERNRMMNSHRAQG